MRDILSDLNKLCLTPKLAIAYASDTVNDLSASSGISSL